MSQGVPLLAGMDRGRRPAGPIKAVFVVVGVVLLGEAVIGAILGLILFGPDYFDSSGSGSTLSSQLFSTVVGFGATLLLLFGWIRWKERRPIASVGFQTRPSHLLAGALAAVAMFTVIVAIGWATGQLRVSGLDWAALGGVLLALAGFAVQGSTEEVLFRGYLLQALGRRWSLPVAAVAQALLFTAFHLFNPDAFKPLAILNLILVGLFLAAWAVAEGGLWGVCAWHAVWNWLQGNVFGGFVSGVAVESALSQTRPAPDSSALLTGADFGLEASLLTTLVLLAGLVYFRSHAAAQRR